MMFQTGDLVIVGRDDAGDDAWGWYFLPSDVNHGLGPTVDIPIGTLGIVVTSSSERSFVFIMGKMLDVNNLLLKIQQSVGMSEG